MIRVGIVGISGYSGGVALELLLRHRHVRVTYVSANNTAGTIEEIWPHLKDKTSLFCDKYDADKAIGLTDCVFLAVPHTTAMDIAPQLLKSKKRVIDFSADYRLKDVALYKTWYGTSHKDKANLSKAIYGLPELYRDVIRKADLIANPGCYPTAALIALAPLAATKTKAIGNIIIDAKSGVSGAGRKATATLMFSEVNENLKAYKVLHHQHTPEINDHRSKLGGKPIDVNFVPHLIPLNRGILETIYVQMKNSQVLKDIVDIYKKFYKAEKFVRILKPGQQPQIKDVVRTNFCDLGFTINEKEKLLVIVAAIDNLMKGAAGQAVQNMNIMYGFEETAGLQ